jgi:hypothetical protein
MAPPFSAVPPRFFQTQPRNTAHTALATVSREVGHTRGWVEQAAPATGKNARSVSVGKSALHLRYSEKRPQFVVSRTRWQWDHNDGIAKPVESRIGKPRTETTYHIIHPILCLFTRARKRLADSKGGARCHGKCDIKSTESSPFTYPKFLER